jgi:hypothetical protein
VLVVVEGAVVLDVVVDEVLVGGTVGVGTVAPPAVQVPPWALRTAHLPA